MHQITGSMPNTPDFRGAASIFKNMVFILTAAVSFALWLASTITTPKRIEKLEEAVATMTAKQAAIETQTNLIHGDLKEIKAVIINKNIKEM